MSIPVVANGDVYTRADMADIRTLSGCRCATVSELARTVVLDVSSVVKS